MSVHLKPLADQTVVITGASSGIGLVTARRAAERGARVVLAARSGDALETLAREIGRDRAVAVVADVTDRADVRRIAETAVERFGGFDTWVNDAGAFIYGTLEDVPVEDMRRLFEVNLWGLVYGSLEAVAHFKARGGEERRGGALVNVGSVLSDRAIPLQGIYCASKHAVKGFTDALRMELAAESAPVSVSLVKPNAIDTPYPRHAKNYMDREAKVPPPVYSPDAVARAILHCAEHPTRDVIVGGGGKQVTMLGHVAPGLLDTVMEKVFIPLMRGDAPARPLAENSLDGPAGRLEERGGYDGHVFETSLYTQAVLHPWRALGLAALAGAGVALAARTR